MEQNHSDEHDDVVVIEERDKRTYLYIGIAAAIGLALGGLIGSTVTSSKWESAYHKLDKRYDSLQKNTAQQSDHAQATIAKTKGSVQQRIDDAVAKVKEQQAKKIQGEKVRVTGKKRDDLQTAIAHLRNAELELPLQFENFRD